MAFLILMLALVVAWCFFSFLLASHEAGHFVACRAQNVPVTRVQIGLLRLFSVKVGGVVHDVGLFPFVGAVHYDPKAVSAKQLAIIAAAGPLVSAAIGAFLLFVAFLYPVDGGVNFVRLAGIASLALAALNLVPLPPMDGWPLLRYALEERGIVISPCRQKSLFFAGLAFIALTTIIAAQ